ncbi:MAG: hypothetical protein IIB39_06040 [Candidatus Marinimicrobia bacterium]|nr:hypothetical protein [Candidatus Neomarinimicrobiota bacterium]
MFKILIIAAIVWIVYNIFKASRFIKSTMSADNPGKKVKRKKLNYNKNDVEDAEFDDIDEN